MSISFGLSAGVQFEGKRLDFLAFLLSDGTLEVAKNEGGTDAIFVLGFGHDPRAFDSINIGLLLLLADGAAGQGTDD